MKADGSAPRFDLSAHLGDAKSTHAALGFEERCIALCFRVLCQPQLKRAMNHTIDPCCAVVAILRLLEVDAITGPQVSNIADPQGDQLVRSVGRVDPKSEQAKIARCVSEQRLDGLNGENIKLITDESEAEIPFNALVKAKLVLTDELIKKTANL